VLAALAFPQFNLSPLAFVALVPFGLVLVPPGGRPPAPGRAFRLGWYYGLAFFLVLLHWIPNLPPENVTVPFLMYPALLLMAFYLGLYPAVWAAVTARIAVRRPWAVLLAGPALWALLEALRAFGVTGFPWGSLGYSQWAALPFIQFAEIGGIWSVSFVIVLVNLLLVFVIRGRGAARPLALAAAVLCVLGPWAYGRARLTALDGGDHPTWPVLLVQQNTGNDKWDAARRSEIVHNLVNLTLDHARTTDPRTLVIWPETATPTLLLMDPANYGYVKSAAAMIRRPILTGFPDTDLDPPAPPPGTEPVRRYFNAAGLILPGEGVVESYRKMRLVPFSEWMPIPGLNRVNFGQSNFTPGDTLHVFTGLGSAQGNGGARFAVLICFESIFPDLARDFVRHGARFLVNITNDQWFGRSPAPYQHLTMAVFRAVENRVGVARAANTGVSGLIDRTGRIREATGLFVPATVTGSVDVGTGETFYTRHGDWILLLSAALLALAVLPALRRNGASGG